LAYNAPVQQQPVVYNVWLILIAWLVFNSTLSINRLYRVMCIWKYITGIYYYKGEMRGNIHIIKQYKMETRKHSSACYLRIWLPQHK